MKVLRTPDERFQNLPDWPYEPRYADVPRGDGGGTLRVHYVAEGPTDAQPILLLHGEPTWAYLYRHMIPVLTAAGHRVIVPDQVGFGRSDKPAEKTDYSYARHVAWMSSLVFDHLDLGDVTFFGQDWGGLIGLRLVAAQPERFARVAVSNTGLPTGDFRPSDAFMAWQEFSQTTPEFPVGTLVNRASLSDLSPDVIAAYDAPFPDDSYTSGARIWPSFVPTSPDDPEAPANRAAWEVLRRFDKPFLCCFSDSDPVTAGGDKPFIKLVPGAAGQSHTTITGAGHFVQEDKGPELARLLIEFIGRR
ncbi:MAG: haloalkane dehalogenase [Acidimicrobiia bacterium]|nr:haloalkane dehalogenase [Acidimicrobiia bacterium]